MSELRSEKFVNSLPGTLSANTIYYVKVGAKVEAYVTNNTGTIIALPIQTISTSSHDGGRADSIYGGNTIIDGGGANG